MLSLPVDIGTSFEPSQSSLSKYYKHTEQEHPGGYFPVGINTTWHGGLHLHAKKGSLVKAMAGGNIIAARLGEEDKAKKHYGSNNFILCEHTYKETKYYSLYLHLNWEKLEKGNSALRDIPWLQKSETDDIDEGLLGKLKSGDVCKIENKRICAGDTLWTVGTYGSKKYRADMIHWEIFSEKLLPGNWFEIEDKDHDFNCDNKSLINLIDQPGEVMLIETAPDGNIDSEELKTFFKNPQRCERLRHYACKFILEYAVNWDLAVEKLKGRWNTWGLADRIKPYCWWDEAKKAKITLPSTPIVWHYNPVAFIEQALFTSARARLIGAHFENNSSFPLHTICGHVKAIADYVHKHENSTTIVLGYANSGDKKIKDKKGLSLKRAESIIYLLSGNKTNWVKMFTEEHVWGDRERQIILRHLTKADNSPYYPEEKSIDGINGVGQKTAVTEFQKDNSLKTDGKAGVGTLGVMFEKYYTLSDKRIRENTLSAVGCSDTHSGSVGSNTIDAIVFEDKISPSVQKYETDAVYTWNKWQDAVDFEIHENRVSIAPTVQFVYPSESEHKQYVNLDDNGADEGKNLTLKVKVENPVEGQTIYWKVTAEPNNCERSDPKIGLKENDGKDLNELDSESTATCTSKVKNGEAKAILVCGVAGGDRFTIEAGVVEGDWLDSVSVTNWRRLYYELQAPEFIELQKVEQDGSTSKDYTQITRNWIDKCLAVIFVEYRMSKWLEYTKAQCPAGTLFSPNYFNLGAKVSRDMHVLPPAPKTHPKPFGAKQNQTIQVRVCDKSFYWQKSYVHANITIPHIDASGYFFFNVADVFNKYCLPKDLATGKIGIDLTSGGWRAMPPAGNPVHPGFSSPGTPRSGNLANWAIANNNQWFIQIKPPIGPGSPASLIGPVSATTCPVEINLKLLLCSEINGAAAGNRQVMVFKKDFPQTMASTICHELGHSMGMTILPGRNPTPPGLIRPRHVDENDSKGVAGFYYRHKISDSDEYGTNGVRGPAHVGGHCAAGIADRGTSKNLAGKNGACVMFGEGGDKEPPTRRSYCSVCKKYLKARNLEDIVSPWQGRKQSMC